MREAAFQALRLSTGEGEGRETELVWSVTVTRAQLTRDGTTHQNCSRLRRGQQDFCFLTHRWRLQLPQEEGVAGAEADFCNPRQFLETA